MTCAMRRRGIRVDTAKAESAIRELEGLRDTQLSALSDRVAIGRRVTIHDVNSPKWLEKVFDAVGIVYPRTPKNNQGSFQADWLVAQDHWLPQAVAKANLYHDTADKFIQGFVLNYCHRGRIHAEIHHLRTVDEERGHFGGTRSHRFSYSDPPLQQMPSPKRGSKEQQRLGLMIRSCFLPEEGERWGKSDWSQQEYRLATHFASLLHLPKVDEVVQMYHSDPKTDFHNVVVELTGLKRSEAKDANFSKMYGAGVDKFALMTNKSKEEAKQIMGQYDELFPFIKLLAGECARTATRRGYIRLIDGARARFDMWEPSYGYHGKYHPPCNRKEAEARAAADSNHDWMGVQLRRAYTHKSMNRLIQGSAARQCKLAMREIARAGLTPLLQLHDELDFSWSDPRTPAMVKAAMQDTVKLVVPMLADCEIGPNWGEATEKI